MKVRGFKTFTNDLSYFSFNFLPTIGFEGSQDFEKCIFIGWMIWGIQIKW